MHHPSSFTQNQSDLLTFGVGNLIIAPVLSMFKNTLHGKITMRARYKVEINELVPEIGPDEKQGM